MAGSREPVSGPACCGCAGVLEHVPEEVDGDVQVFLQDDGEVRILKRLKTYIQTHTLSEIIKNKNNSM